MSRAERQSRPRKQVSCQAQVTLAVKTGAQKGQLCHLDHGLELYVYPDNGRTVGQEKMQGQEVNPQFLEVLEATNMDGLSWGDHDRNLRPQCVQGECRRNGKEPWQLRSHSDGTQESGLST